MGVVRTAGTDLKKVGSNEERRKEGAGTLAANIYIYLIPILLASLTSRANIFL